MSRPFRMALLATLLTTFLASSASAIQQRQVEFVSPRGGSRGTTVEILLQGMDLEGPREILFYRPGIVASDFETLPTLKEPIGLAHGGKAIEQVRVRFRIAADCPVGEHPFRLRTDTTLGTLCTFWVGPFPTIDERERGQGGNDSPSLAEPVALGSTVAGRIHEGSRLDRDLYRVTLKRGQRLGVEVDSMRLCMMGYGGSEFDLMALVLDRDGHELARNDDNGLHVQDPLLSFVAPTDGDYLVEVRQRIYRPHPWGFYRLHLGDFARPLAVYPAGGQAGGSISARLLGDAEPEVTQEVAIPGFAGSFDFFPGLDGHQPPSAMTLRSSPFGNVLEAEAGETRAPSLPIALNGRIEAPGDEDTFRLPCRKGTTYRVRAFAGSLGSLLDPRIWLRPVGSTSTANELEADDSRPTARDLFGLSNELQPRDLLDPSVLFTPEQDGDYFLGIADTRGMGGPTFVYRVEVEPAVDSIFTYVRSTAHDAFEANRVTGFIAPRDNRWTLNLLLGEGQGNRYQGDLELTAFGLPSGVEMIAPRVEAGARMVPVQFVASPSATEGTALIEILARPVGTPGATLAGGSRQGFSFANQSGGHAFHHLTLDRFALAVTRPAPFRIELVPPRVALCRGGELNLDVKLIRERGFDEPVDFQADWLPPGLAGESAVTFATGQAEAKFAIHADARARSPADIGSR